MHNIIKLFFNIIIIYIIYYYKIIKNNYNIIIVIKIIFKAQYRVTTEISCPLGG